ncbi:lipocalin-like domain-containing protein [Nonomuraea sp. GTA35]|uniref:lipocalin-like domain-containing protein n=1 Tax=Nonomuraea sp. GTA35 TaxID=1676746 RepID=UPI0035C0ADA6
MTRHGPVRSPGRGPAGEQGRKPVAYAGSFEVVDATTVEHHVTTSLFPNWMGRRQVRKVSFAGELLKLGIATPTRLWGAQRTAELIWSRLV